MTDELNNTRSISIPEFRARCTEWLRAVEEQGIRLHITRQGKVVAIIEPSESEGPAMDEWIGSGVGFTNISNDVLASFDEPTWSNDEWFTADEVD